MRRLCRIFLRGADRPRPVFGDSPIEQEDPHFCDNLLFYELSWRYGPRSRHVAPDRLGSAARELNRVIREVFALIKESRICISAWPRGGGFSGVGPLTPTPA